MGRQDVEHNLVSQHVEWDWKEENKCDVAFTAASYECVHVNKSWRDGRSRWSSCCLRFHTIDALLGLSVCVQQSDGQVHETHETTRTQIGWFQPWFYLCFGCPQDIHTKKNKKRETNQRACPHPGPSCFRTQMSEQLLMAGDTYRYVWGGDGENGSIKWKFHMMGGGQCKTERNVWLDKCRAGDWLFPCWYELSL